MARSDIRSNKQNVEIEHRTARGKVRRNSSTFTRGSQLLVHEYLMTFSGIKIPIIIWLCSLVVISIFMLWMMMGNYEIQLILMRGLAIFWEWVGFDSEKIANLTITDGVVVQVYMLDVPKHPAVMQAWNHFTSAMTGSFIMSLFFGVPLAWWFVSASTSRGTNILEERHERGALLVDLP